MVKLFLNLLQNIVLLIFPSRHHYDYQKALEKYGFALTRPRSDLHRLSLMLPYIIVKSMKLGCASILIFDPAKNHYVLHIHDTSKEHHQLDQQVISRDSVLIQELASGKRELILEEVKKMAAREGLPEAEKKKYLSLEEEMKNFGSVLSLPAAVEGRKPENPPLLLIFNFGRMLSGENYTRGDIGFLRKFGNQVVATVEPALKGNPG
jgi:hypothetical protein